MKFPTCFAPARISNTSARLSLALVAGALGYLCPASLSAQTVTFTGAKPSVDVGTVNLCKPGLTVPAPCNKTVTLDYKVTAGGTLGTPKVLTQGYADLDFTLANGTTCTGGVTTGETCAVNVTFAPRYPGTREGGVLIVDEHGNVLATTYLYGEANGPQIGFTPGTVITNSDLTEAIFGQAAIDGEGNLIEVAGATFLKIPADGGPTVKIRISPSPPNNCYDDYGPAIDGVGNRYINCAYEVWEIPVGGGPQTGLSLPGDYIGFGLVAADKFGDVLLFGSNFAPEPTQSVEVIIPPGGGEPTILNSFPNGNYGDFVFWASDPSGNLFGGAPGVPLAEYPAGSVVGESLPFVASPPYYQIGPASVDAVGNVYAYNSLASYGEYDFLELPLGSGPQVAVPLPSSADFPPLVGPTGDFFFKDGFELLRSIASPLNFGSLPIGRTKTLPLGITNTGNQPLVIKPYYKSPSYKILSAVPAGCEAGTAPGATCTLNIQFTALAVGDHTIELTISGNAKDATLLMEGVGTK